MERGMLPEKKKSEYKQTGLWHVFIVGQKIQVEMHTVTKTKGSECAMYWQPVQGF